ncbi:glycosyltransferase [Thiomicrospira microaerophila]|uniref:glycosyltransferase n=1 Tax=Thiomicrospira microaerophila TaxID=406020 RepID=UPI00200EA5D6|nr:glycosyltransferase [Thiomicrospira microaerophila]UQB43256.1 glycosyltransferase [Thiomicrospira microaerophila]
MTTPEPTLLQQANKAYREKDYPEALGLYKKIIEQSPEMKSVVSFNLANAERKLTNSKVNEPNTPLKSKPQKVDETQSTKFDPEYYLEHNPDVKAAGMDPEQHYFSNGEKEGRQPNRFFDPIFYLRLNADVRHAKISPFAHFCQNGAKEKRLTAKPCLLSAIKKSAKKKPLLFVGHDGIQAGAQVVLLETVKWFAQSTDRNIKVLVLSPGPMADQYALYSDVYVIKNAEVDDKKALTEFLKDDFEFVFLSTVVSGRFISVLKQLNKKINAPFIANIHEMEQVLEIFKEELKQLIPVVDLWISGSPETTKVLHEKYNLPKNKLETVTAFVNPVTTLQADNSDLKNSARKELGLKVNDFVLMGCGTVYWRKGPDLFLETARDLLKRNIKNLKFIWIGEGKDKKALQESLTTEEEKQIKFVGHKSNANELFAAADLFFLSSREDPFPLVVLHAAQFAIPSLYFSGTTGIADFLQQDAGVPIENLSPNQAADCVYNLVQHPEKLQTLGQAAKTRLFNQYTTDIKMLQVFSALIEHDVYKPSVSVIIPFYNHEKFLKERIDSITNQPVKDIEVLCLDDCSTDNSVEIAKQYLHDPRITLHLNEINSGSPFKQWQKGIALAKSDVVWIAEGDDACSPNFLQELLPAFDDPFVNIAYASFKMIDEKSQIKKDAFKPYFDMVSPTKFTQPYVNTGIKEIQEHFAAYQTLINASGLLVRKSSFGQTLEQATSHKMCGDWLIYLECLKNGKIAYNPKAVNYFRRHGASQVVKIEGTEQYFKERFEVLNYVVCNFSIEKRQLLNSIQSTKKEWFRFKHKHNDKKFDDVFDRKAIISSHKTKKINKNINLLVVVSDLSPGGGQLFSIRLANAWKKSGKNTVLVNVGHHPTHDQVKVKIDANVPFFNSSEIELDEICEIYDIDIIHSSIWWSDKYVHENYNKLPDKVRWVLSMHGCYENLIESKDLDSSFGEYFDSMLMEVDYWAYTAEKNMKVFDKYYYPENLSKVLNGYEPEKPLPLNKHELCIRENSTIVCLASRANEDKGWFVAVGAVEQLNNQGVMVDLLLIGEGPAADELKNQNLPNYIKFLGQVSNLQDFISITDIGLLPTMFISESMPLVLIEFMAQGKPIVSTDVGEIQNMTQDHEGNASIIMNLQNGKVTSQQVSESIEKIIVDQQLNTQLQENSLRRFQFFSMDVMLQNYTKIYKNVLGEKL